jgi:predicted nuclease with TOPRIM domain
MNGLARILPDAAPADWTDLGRGQMEELRRRLDELRNMVTTLVERDRAGEKTADKLDERVEKLEARIERIELETGKLGVKVGGIVAGAIVLIEAIPRILEKLL